MTAPTSFAPLASAYALYFGALGISAPYLNLYLKDRGFSLAAIGSLTALLIAVRIVGQISWSWLADSFGRPVLMIRVAATITCALVALGGLVTGKMSLAVVMVCWSLILAACLPQLESITLSRLGDNKDRYGRIRLWGSVGFIVSVLVVGRVLDSTGTQVVIPLMVLAYAGLAIVLLRVPVNVVTTTRARSDASEPLRRTLSRVWVLLLVCFLMQASHAPFYTFFSIHLQSLGYTSTQIGALWAIGVICEVGVFYIGSQLFRVIGAQWLLVLTFAVASLRWVLLATTAHLPVWVSVSQCLHGLTFGACHAAAIHLIHARFPASSQHRGQAVYASITYGCGTAVGTWLTGMSWQYYGPTATLMAASAAAAIACLIGACWTVSTRSQTPM